MQIICITLFFFPSLQIYKYKSYVSPCSFSPAYKFTNANHMYNLVLFPQPTNLQIQILCITLFFSPNLKIYKCKSYVSPCSFPPVYKFTNTNHMYHLVLFPQPPIQAELFGSSPVLSFT